MTMIWKKIKTSLYFLFSSNNENNYDKYNILCTTLDKIDFQTVLQSRLMGGTIPAMFILEKFNPNTAIFTCIIRDSFPNALIIEDCKENIPCAQFY